MKILMKRCFLVLMLFSSQSFSSHSYQIKIKIVDTDLYKVINKDFYISTRDCYEYIYGDEAVLKIDSTYGYNIGELIFVDTGEKCDVKKISK